jgi:hypothetical protein
MKKNVLINVGDNELQFHSTYISELGFLMVKFFDKENLLYKTYNFGLFDKKNNIFTKNILPNQK